MTETIEREERTAGQREAIDLNGTFYFKVDAKGRVALPAKFRKVLTKDLVVTPDTKEQCIYVFETPDFNQWVNKLFVDNFGGYKESESMHVNLRRKLKGRANDVEVDASGRIMLSSEVRSMVGIDKEVAIVGNTGRFEIWDAKRYAEIDEQIDLKMLVS